MSNQSKIKLHFMFLLISLILQRKWAWNVVYLDLVYSEEFRYSGGKNTNPGSTLCIITSFWVALWGEHRLEVLTRDLYPALWSHSGRLPPCHGWTSPGSTYPGSIPCIVISFWVASTMSWVNIAWKYLPRIYTLHCDLILGGFHHVMGEHRLEVLTQDLYPALWSHSGWLPPCHGWTSPGSTVWWLPALSCAQKTSGLKPEKKRIQQVVTGEVEIKQSTHTHTRTHTHTYTHTQS